MARLLFTKTQLSSAKLREARDAEKTPFHLRRADHINNLVKQGKSYAEAVCSFDVFERQRVALIKSHEQVH